MRLTQITFTLLSVLAVQPASWACLNDRDSDTLANQARGLPDVVQVITGRFERNPPTFYQMRIERVQKELRLNPSRLPLYDDIGVALDRVGRDDEAIKWMKKKKAQLDRLNASASTHDKVVHEHLYRYYANLGTFVAHRWLRAGANRANLADMKAARALIAQAIRLKPNAHFGREKYQLMAMEWILAPHNLPLEKSGYRLYFSFASYMWGGFQSNSNGYQPSQGADSTRDKSGYQPGYAPDEKRKAKRKAEEEKRRVEGLAGLIVLGNAWESVDIYDALAQALGSYSPQPINGRKFSESKAVTLQCLARLRCRELIEKGRRPLFATAATQKELIVQWGQCHSMYPKNILTIEAIYRRLRQEAEQWQAKRAGYMMTRLKAGRHPDTDSNFWSGWKDGGPPSLETPEHWQTFADELQASHEATRLRNLQSFRFMTVITGGSLILLTVLIGLWRSRNKRRAKTA